MTNSSKAIWGHPHNEVEEADELFGIRGATEEVSIKREIYSFLDSEIKHWKPDLILVHDRKGTAVMRSLIEGGDQRLNWTWTKVISSSVIDQLPLDQVCNKRILVFDDMMKTGIHLADVLESLERRCGIAVRDCVRVAVFAIHEEYFRNGNASQLRVNAWFYRNLTNPAYQMIRQRIIRMLQQEGSLMLDTEHIEVRIRLHTGFNRFVAALRRKADPIVFHSLGNRVNITVYYGDDEAHKLNPERFRKGCGYTRIVKKCRIVERSPDVFAIIPICLPSVPVEDEKWSFQPEDAAMLGEGAKLTSMGEFYGAALIGSLFPLTWILRDLYASDPKSFTLYLPSRLSEDTSNSAYTLDHLQVMYPTICMDKLIEQINQVENDARKDGTRLRRIKIEPHEPIICNDDELRKDAITLLQVIRHTLTERSLDVCHVTNKETPMPGLRASEIFDLGLRLKWKPAKISTLFDILIDDANLVTRVETTKDEDGAPRWTRTFKPDGEVVSNLLARYTRQWGMPHGF